MLLKITSRQGNIQLDEETLGVFSFGKYLWQVQRIAITAFEYQPAVMQTVTLTIHTTSGDYVANGVIRKEFTQLCTFFPGIPVTEKPKEPKPEKPAKPPKPAKPRFWWEDTTRLTYIATYTNEKQLRLEIEQAYQHGWIIQDQSGQSGQISAAKVIGGAILAGPLGAMVGAIRSKGKTTITFVRSDEWRAAHLQP